MKNQLDITKTAWITETSSPLAMARNSLAMLSLPKTETLAQFGIYSSGLSTGMEMHLGDSDKDSSRYAKNVLHLKVREIGMERENG